MTTIDTYIFVYLRTHVEKAKIISNIHIREFFLMQDQWNILDAFIAYIKVCGLNLWNFKYYFFLVSYFEVNTGFTQQSILISIISNLPLYFSRLSTFVEKKERLIVYLLVILEKSITQNVCNLFFPHQFWKQHGENIKS